MLQILKILIAKRLNYFYQKNYQKTMFFNGISTNITFSYCIPCNNKWRFWTFWSEFEIKLKKIDTNSFLAYRRFISKQKQKNLLWELVIVEFYEYCKLSTYRNFWLPSLPSVNNTVAFSDRSAVSSRFIWIISPVNEANFIFTMLC